MTRRVCSEPGCPTLTDVSRCERHTRERDMARGTRQERGYDAEHDRLRRRWAPIVATGVVTCRRAPSGHCLNPTGPLIGADQPWQLGHPDAECAAPRAPEHRLCNVSTAPRRISQGAYAPQGVTPSHTQPGDRGGGLRGVVRVQTS